MTTPPHYTGHLQKGAEPCTIEGWIEDKFGWRITLHGTLSPEGGYVLTGTLGEPPASLRIAAVDGPQE